MNVLLGLLVLGVCAAAPPTLADGVVRVLFVGDTSFCETFQDAMGGANVLAARGYDEPFRRIDPLLAAADLVVANLESPLTTRAASPCTGRKAYVLRGDPVRTPAALARHGLRAVSLANNHGMDYGAGGLRDTLAALDRHGVRAFAAGASALEAARPLVVALAPRAPPGAAPVEVVVLGGFERSDSHVALGFYAGAEAAGVDGWEPSTAAARVRAARAAHPKAFLVAFPHWGPNYVWRTANERAIARAAVDAGADLVLGHGAHQLQEIERWKGRWIAYGLGNFMFLSTGEYRRLGAPPWGLAALLELTPSPGGRPAACLRLYPILTDNLTTDWRPRPATEAECGTVRALLLRHAEDPAALEPALGLGRGQLGPHLFLLLDPPLNERP